MLNFGKCLPGDYKELKSLSTFTSKIKNWETDYVNADNTKLYKIYERINIKEIIWYTKHALGILVKRQTLMWMDVFQNIA